MIPLPLFFDQHNIDVLTGLVAKVLPSLALHLAAAGVHAIMYATAHFMTVFSGLPYWDTVLALWDMVLLESVLECACNRSCRFVAFVFFKT